MEPESEIPEQANQPQQPPEQKPEPAKQEPVQPNAQNNAAAGESQPKAERPKEKKKAQPHHPRVERQIDKQQKRPAAAPTDDDGLTTLERTLLEEMAKRGEITKDERLRIENEARLSKLRKKQLEIEALKAELAGKALQTTQAPQQATGNHIASQTENVVELAASPKYPEERIHAPLPYGQAAKPAPMQISPVAAVARGEIEPQPVPQATAQPEEEIPPKQAHAASEAQDSSEPQTETEIPAENLQPAKPKIVKVTQAATPAPTPESPRIVEETDYSMLTNSSAPRQLARGEMINGKKIEPDLEQEKRNAASRDALPLAVGPGDAFGEGEVLQMDEETRRQREADLAVKLWEQKQKERSIVNRLKHLVGLQ